MKTAVDWLVEQYKKVGGISISMAEIAKEMEKEKIIDAYITSHISMMSAEQYYYETFKQQEQ
jgi:hypothetical protein